MYNEEIAADDIIFQRRNYGPAIDASAGSLQITAAMLMITRLSIFAFNLEIIAKLMKREMQSTIFAASPLCREANEEYWPYIFTLRVIEKISLQTYFANHRHFGDGRPGISRAQWAMPPRRYCAREKYTAAWEWRVTTYEASTNQCGKYRWCENQAATQMPRRLTGRQPFSAAALQYR